MLQSGSPPRQTFRLSSHSSAVTPRKIGRTTASKDAHCPGGTLGLGVMVAGGVVTAGGVVSGGIVTAGGVERAVGLVVVASSPFRLALTFCILISVMGPPSP